MKIPPVKGTRDFYPPDMARRNWIIDGWKKVSVRNGFEEYDGPIFEYLKMFQIKSGDEIVDQLFSFKDRGGRDLALRPEITPTLARMVNQQINSLPKPIKWFSVPRLFRAERPQKGRLREFFQWNIDIIGTDDVRADAEVIFCALDYLEHVGLTPDDIVVKISSRRLLAAVLKKIGISEDSLDSIYPVLDKKDKLPPETFAQILKKQIPDKGMVHKIQTFMETKNVSEIRRVVKYEPSDEIDEAVNEQAMLIHHLNQMGVADYCVFDPSIVRGLAYYTGVVYEIYDKSSELRAIGGGGRYDNLLRDFGGPEIPATGFGIGDCVLEILLEKKGLIDKNLHEKRLDYFVATVDKPLNIETVDGVVEKTEEDIVDQLTAKLRRAGYSVAFSYKSGGLGKQLGEASDRNAQKCIIIGEEFKNNQLVIKDMATGKQELVNIDEFLSKLKS
jgi:histidyl-tRNA synthetase